jgi:hypothetical protein
MNGFYKHFTLTGAEGETLPPVGGILSHRSSEENEEGELSRSMETVLLVVQNRYAPAGGFQRGMTLSPQKDGGTYRILTPVFVGRLWRLKAERLHTEP